MPKKLLLLLLMFVMSGVITAQEDLPVFEDLEPGEWNRIVPEGDTICMYDTEYSFFVRPAETPTDDLMIFFEGGGACWDSLTCGLVGQFASRYDVPETLMSVYTEGVFDFENPLNPVADYNVVFVPYCTGDVHSGTNEIDYDEDLNIDYNGVTNAQAVLTWTFANFMAPEDVFVTGCSAGGYGATYHAPFIMNQYPENRVVMLSDAANGVTPDAWEGYEEWDVFTGLPEFIEPLDTATVETYNNNLSTIAAAQAFPQNTFAQWNTFLDEVQVGFYGLLTDRLPVGDEVIAELAAEWSAGLVENLETIDSEVDNFYAYTAGGPLHCITPRPEFYTYIVDDVSVVDWVDSLLVGEDMRDVSCDVTTTDCLEPPTVE